MDQLHAPALEGLFRCGLPKRRLNAWLEQHGKEGLRIASYGLSSYEYFGYYLPQNVHLQLLIGVSGIDPSLVSDLSGTPARERWQKLLERSASEQRSHVLKVLRRSAGWQRAGAKVRVAPPGRRSGLMHLKLYLGSTAALVGSANFTSQGMTGEDQHELLLEVNGPSLIELSNWWSSMWDVGWPIDGSLEDLKAATFRQSVHSHSYPKESRMNSGPQTLLGHWLGKWGAWALNGNGVVAYPHQLQAVEWIRPDGGAYLLGDEVGLGKTFTAALIWMRHLHLYGEKARLIYITKPSLIIDAISAFVDVLGVDELLQTTASPPQRANDLRPNFSIFHAGTVCWDMVADEGGRKRNKDHQVAGLLKEGRYRVRPQAFLKNKLEWLSALAARRLHEQINISAIKRLTDSVYTFVSIDTLRNPENPITHVFDKIEQSSLVPLLIVDESHGLGRTTLRRSAIADLIWGPRDYAGKPAILRSPGALVVYMTGTPVHPNESETASRLGLLDLDPKRTPHKLSYYDDVRTPPTRDMLEAVRERAVIRRKDDIRLDGKPDGLPIFPKRMVFPFQKWIGSEERSDSRPPDDITKTNKDVLMAIDQYVASEASHGAKLVSLIRRILRSGREWGEIKQLVKDSEARKKLGDEIPLGERVVKLADDQIGLTSGDDQIRWRSLRMALEAARVYEEKLKDPRLENLTWKAGRDDNGNEEKQMLFTKVGWVATAYDSLAKGTKRAVIDAPETAIGDVPDEDEETAGELTGSFDTVDEMMASAKTAKRLADEYLEPTLLDDDSKVRFSMLVALLEGMASLRLWPKKYPSMADEDRFGWGVEERDGDRLRASLASEHSELNLKQPWVVHARYIHSVVDTAVRLQLRYGSEGGKPLVGIIIGDTPNYKRDEIKDDFSKGKLNIVCMSDAGAEGINLQRSNRIVLLDVPVSPGRIEQIAGRVHRLGSTHAAQVTLLLPPGYFGTRVFEALRKAASSVFRMAAGALPTRSESGADDDPYYVRQLADYEARLLTAVAETSGVIRGEENREALQKVVNQPELNGEPNTAPIAPLFKSGFELIQEQRKRFADESAATQSALMPVVTDLVDALVKFEGATESGSSSKFRVPIRIIMERDKPEEYGDLVTREQPFRVLELKEGRRYWHGPQRFLPTDVPEEKGFEWLGVIGNAQIVEVLRSWRHEPVHVDGRNSLEPEIWISSAVPQGKALAFCGISNEYKADGSPAASLGEKALHVMLGFADYNSPHPIQWRPFFARGASVPFKSLATDTWLPSILPALDERWAATLIRRVTGLEQGYSTRSAMGENERQAASARDSAVREIRDEEEGTTSWRLNKENVKTWLDGHLPQWWAGGVKLGCRPQFFLIAFGEKCEK